MRSLCIFLLSVAAGYLLCGWVGRKKRRGYFEFTVSVEDKATRRTKMLTGKCTTEQNFRVLVNPKTSAGADATIQADSLAVTTGEGQTGTVEQQTDGGFLAVSNGTGFTDYTVTGDADLGDGVVAIEDIFRLEVVDPNASSLGLEAGGPEPK